MSNYRHEHLESEILNILNHTMKHEIYDAQIKCCSFTAVKLTPDYNYVVVYTDTYNRDKIDQIIEKLTIAKGVFRTQMAHNLKLRRIPDIKFVKDESIDKSLKIDDLLSKIH